LRKGPYGNYVQLGEATGNGKVKEKPKRASLPRGLAPAEVDLARALGLLALPREIGRHPESGDPISAGIGRFGPYLKHGLAFKSLGADDDVLTIGLNRAVSLLAEPSTGRGRAPPGKPVGAHPADGQTITLHSGRYGPYLRHAKIIASLPRGMDPDELNLDGAVSLLAAQVEKAKDRPGKRRPAPVGTRPKTAAKTKAVAKTRAKPKAAPKAAKRKAPKTD